MKEIILANGRGVAIVDDEDFEWLSQWSWQYNNGYALHKINQKNVYMHRLIAKAGTGQFVDHIDKNRLNNQRNNIRIATRQQNNANVDKRSVKRPYKGVFLSRSEKRWRSEIGFNNKRIALGSFATPGDAARAYDHAALEYFGEFARLNFPS